MARLKAVLLLLTIATALALAGYFTVYLAWQDLRPWRHYRVAFKKTAGLRKDDDVYVYGLVVGRVYKVELEGDHQVAELEVEPTVSLYRSGTKVSIQSIDAFGDVAVFIEPGDPSSLLTYSFEEEIPGEISEGFSLGTTDDTPGATGRFSESLREFVRTTDGLLNADSGLAGRALNDPDLAAELREGLEQLHRSVADFNESARRFLEGDEGPSALISEDGEQRYVEAMRRLRDSFEPLRDGWREAAQGGDGAAGRIVGDPTVRDATFDAYRTLAIALESYRTGDTLGGPSFITHAPEPAERLADALEALSHDTEDARHGMGALGGLFGPGTGAPTREALANLGQTLEGARVSDAATGNLFSPSIEARRRNLEDPISRIEDTLREMRGALGRLRASQAPNTFQGAVFSVF